ncbi:MAG: hypothetical protein GYB31_02300 [Bacteroidetes bacterium]|nr:hypothetical protein [Bacteroidota bacterium]
MPRLVLLLLFLLPTAITSAQFDRDSLRQVIDTSPNDTSVVRAMRHLSYDIVMGNPDSLNFSINLATRAADYARTRGIESQEMFAFYDRAFYHYLQGRLEASEADYRRAIETAIKLDAKDDQAAFEDGLATILFEQGKKEKAIRLKHKTIDYYQTQQDTFNFLRSNGVLAHLYIYNGEYQKAKERLDLIFSFQYDYSGMIENYGNMGLVYAEFGQLDSAIYYMEEAHKMGTDYPNFIFKNQMALAEVYSQKGEKEKALNLLEELNTSYAEAEDKDLYKLKILLAQYYLQLGQADKAAVYFEEAEAGLLSKDLLTQKDRWYTAYQIFEQQTDYRKALEYFKKYHAVSDSLMEVQRDSAYQDIESKYQLAKKDEELSAQKLKTRKTWIVALALAALLCIGLLLFYFRNKNEKYKSSLLRQKSQNQELEIAGLRKENQLIALQSILEGQEEERRRIAQDLHDNISSMMAAIRLKVLAIQSDHAQLDNMLGQVSEEVRRISHNMTPLSFGLTGIRGAIEDLIQLLKSKGISAKAQTEALEALNSKERSIMTYRIFQELVNNIIKHSEATQVEINCKQDGNTLHIDIRDNGKGLSGEVWEKSTNLGLKSIRSRIEYLHGEIRMRNKKGTHFHINIPIEEA